MKWYCEQVKLLCNCVCVCVCVCVCFLADGKVRLATLELSCLLLKQSVLSGSQCIIKDVHLACLEVTLLGVYVCCVCLYTCLSVFVWVCQGYNSFPFHSDHM